MLKLSVKDRKSYIDASKTESDTHPSTANDRIVVDSSKHSSFSISSSAVENVSKSAAITTLSRDRTSGHKDITKKLRLHKRVTDSLLASPAEAKRSQNIATFGVESLGCKTPAKVTYVGSGLVPLSSPLLSNVGQTTLLSYALYTPLIGHAQSLSGSQLIGALSPLHTASNLPSTSGSTAVQMINVAGANVCSMTSSLIDTKVVQHTPLIFSAQSPSGSPLIAASYPLHASSRLQAATGSTDVQKLTVADAFVSSSVSDTKLVNSALSACGSQSTPLPYPLHSTSHLPMAVSSANVQPLAVADIDVCSEDSSVIDTEVVETVADPFSVDHSRKQKKQKQIVNPGRCCFC